MSLSNMQRIKELIGTHKGYSICKELMYIDLSVIFDKASLNSNITRLNTLVEYIEFSNPNTPEVNEVIEIVKQRISNLTIDNRSDK